MLAIYGRRMSFDFILVSGPLVRASSWEPTGRHLREAGYSTQVPDVLAYHQPPPSWSDWNSHLLDLINSRSESVLVGHSSAGALVADLASKVPCQSLIIVDGDVPPSQGAAPPVRPALRDFIRGLAGPDGTLPIWSRWLGMRVAHPSLASISWRTIPRRLPSLKADYRGSLSIGSTTRSNSPIGIVFPPASFRLPQSMIIQLRTHYGGGGQLHDCMARIFTSSSVQPRLRAQSSTCRTNSFHASADRA
jgi:hypothetical protein